MRSIIEQCREQLGPAPRKVPQQLVVPHPSWLRTTDPLSAIYDQQERLLSQGQVVWGALVSVNARLVSPGKLDHPGLVIYSIDPFYDSHLAELLDIAQRISGYEDTPPADSELTRFALEVTDEYNRTLRRPVPMELTGGREVLASNLIIHRRHLPERRLCQMYVPLLVLPDTEAILILPACYWPAPLVDAWEWN